MRSVTTADRHGLNGLEKMSYWEHRPQPSLPKKSQLPSIPQIAALLLEYHELDAEEIREVTIEEDVIHGYVKEEGWWYKFAIYKY